MQARSLVQTLKDSLETQSQLSESELLVTPISGDQKNAAATVMVFIEGQARLFEVKVRDVGTYRGLEAV